jgi:hypothetical protein
VEEKTQETKNREQVEAALQYTFQWLDMMGYTVELVARTNTESPAWCEVTGSGWYKRGGLLVILDRSCPRSDRWNTMAGARFQCHSTVLGSGENSRRCFALWPY